ncbi:hypothetical protein FRUB_03848 [Fimbriiglobus ruber]|uniref:Transmembrane protein n=1 Tax=Fimbriiglobus ruber TaxID=1908690 RepID=A0A225DJX1_9BACT|nr:hypothetical protein FRUB_03848 [Fimbriiglobus ruber]
MAVEVSPPAEPTPAAPAAPPLPFGRPAPAAPPLPFGAPTKAAPARAAPARPKRPAVRAKIAADDPYESPPTASVEPGAEEKRREVLRQLAEYQEEKAIEEEEYEHLAGLCAHARTGLQLLALGALAACVVAVVTMFFFIGSLLGLPLFPLLFLAGGFLVLHWLLTAGGFGFCCAGLPDMRPTAVFGIAFTAGHAVFNLACTMLAIGIVVLADFEVRAEGVALGGLLLSNSVSNMTVAADVPLYLVFGFPTRSSMLVLILIAAAFEFAKLSSIGLLTNQYATAGKDQRLAHDGMRFVYRIFWLVLAAPILKVTVYVMIGVLFPIGYLMLAFISLTVGFYAWWAFTWFAQFQVLNDTREIVVATRVADKRARLDVV